MPLTSGEGFPLYHHSAPPIREGSFNIILMKHIFTLILTLLLALPLSAQDITGKWQWKQNSADPDKDIYSILFNFKKDGTIEVHSVVADDEYQWGHALIAVDVTGTWKQSGKDITFQFNMKTARLTIEDFVFKDGYKQNAKDPKFMTETTAEILDDWQGEEDEVFDYEGWLTATISTFSPKQMILLNDDGDKYTFNKK